MDFFIQEIIKDAPIKQLKILPPLLGNPCKSRKKKAGKRRKIKQNILHNPNLRSKVSSVLNSSPPLSFTSTYKTSRLSRFQSNPTKIKKPTNQRSPSNVSSISPMAGQALSLDNSLIYMGKSLRLPSIHKLSNAFESGSLFLEGNKKKLMGRASYFQHPEATEETKVKVFKEIALETDFYSDDCDMLNYCNESIDELLRSHDRELLKKRNSVDFNG